MNIKTKFNINDKAWLIYDNAARELIVKGFYIRAYKIDDKSSNLSIIYEVGSNNLQRSEDSLFKSKTELLASL